MTFLSHTYIFSPRSVYIASYLIRHQCDINVIAGNKEEEEETSEKIKRHIIVQKTEENKMCGGDHYGCPNAGMCSGAGGYSGGSAMQSYFSGGNSYQSSSGSYQSSSGDYGTGIGSGTYVQHADVQQGDYSQMSRDYSPLESIVHSLGPEADTASFKAIPLLDYRSSPLKYTEGLYLHNRASKQNYFSPQVFLNPHREETEIVEDASGIMEHVKETFKLLTGNDFPENFIKIHVCDVDRMARAHTRFGGVFSLNIRGFAINRMPMPSDIFVQQDHLDSLMITIGHEIGHCISMPLGNKRDEEAKAFAFSMAWMDTIKKHDIAGVGKSIRVKHLPAKNNIHDKAFDFVKKRISEGAEAMQLFRDIATAYAKTDVITDGYWGD